MYHHLSAASSSAPFMPVNVNAQAELNQLLCSTRVATTIVRTATSALLVSPASDPPDMFLERFRPQIVFARILSDVGRTASFPSRQSNGHDTQCSLGELQTVYDHLLAKYPRQASVYEHTLQDLDQERGALQSTCNEFFEVLRAQAASGIWAAHKTLFESRKVFDNTWQPRNAPLLTEKIMCILTGAEAIAAPSVLLSQAHEPPSLGSLGASPAGSAHSHTSRPGPSTGLITTQSISRIHDALQDLADNILQARHGLLDIDSDITHGDHPISSRIATSAGFTSPIKAILATDRRVGWAPGAQQGLADMISRLSAAHARSDAASIVGSLGADEPVHGLARSDVLLEHWWGIHDVVQSLEEYEHVRTQIVDSLTKDQRVWMERADSESNVGGVQDVSSKIQNILGGDCRRWD